MSRQEIVAQTMAQYWNVRDELKDKSLDELKAIVKQDSLPFAVCALNVTGDLNLGIMMRTASLMGAEKFVIYGRHGFDRRSAVGAQNYIDIIKAGSLVPNTEEIDYTDFFPTMKRLGYEPIFFDTGGVDLTSSTIDTMHRHCAAMKVKPCLVFGNEGLGIPNELTNGSIIITIPQRGVLRSLNVGAAASIAIHRFSEYYSKNF